jgi:hypothetical protein
MCLSANISCVILIGIFECDVGGIGEGLQPIEEGLSGFHGNEGTIDYVTCLLFSASADWATRFIEADRHVDTILPS